jgi:hypothetical protein
MMSRFGGGVVGLLRIEQVRDELKLDDAQVGQLTALAEKIRQESRELFSGMRALRDLSEDERQARVEKFRKDAQQWGAEVEKRIAEILKPEQFQRLKQIELQQQGVRVLMREDMIQALGITDEQQSKLQGMAEQFGRKSRELYGGSREMTPDERVGLRKKIDELQRQSEQDAMAVLSDEQKATLKQMMGEPFDLDRSQLRALRGQGRRGAEGGRGGRRPDA